MSTSFCENFRLLAILYQKMKKTTLDGAETTRNNNKTVSDSGVTKYDLQKFQFD